VKEFMAMGPRTDVITRHEYFLGAGVDPESAVRALNTTYFDKQKKASDAIQSAFVEAAPAVRARLPQGHRQQGFPQLWMGEAGGCYNSGRPNVTDVFTSAFWYLDNMAVIAQRGHAAFCRQTLVGGSYSLLDTSKLVPNPDFFAALLWRKLLGRTVLNISVTPVLGQLRLYAHCRAAPTKPAAGWISGGVTILAMNLGAEPVAVDVLVTAGAVSKLYREEYHMTSADAPTSKVVELNGHALTAASAEIRPSAVPKGSGRLIEVAAMSYAFIEVPDAKVHHCP